MTGWNTTFEADLGLLLKDWLKQQGRTQVDPAGGGGQRGRVDQFGAATGQYALAALGRGPEQVVGDDHSEDGVAEELQPLVGLDPTVLGAPRPVAQGEFQMGAVGEAIAETVQEAGVEFGVDGRARRSAQSLAWT